MCRCRRCARFSRYLGGSSANMAVGLARLGARTGIVSCLGSDSLSRFLIEFLKQEKVDTSHVQIAPGYLPSLAITEVSPPDQLPAGVLPARPRRHAARCRPRPISIMWPARACSSPTARRSALRRRANRPIARWSAPKRRAAAWSSMSIIAPCPGGVRKKRGWPYAWRCPSSMS